jgi:hypothetical protein
MGAPGKALQHFQRIGAIPGLSQHGAVERHDRIGGEHGTGILCFPGANGRPLS